METDHSPNTRSNDFQELRWVNNLLLTTAMWLVFLNILDFVADFFRVFENDFTYYEPMGWIFSIVISSVVFSVLKFVISYMLKMLSVPALVYTDFMSISMIIYVIFGLFSIFAYLYDPNYMYQLVLSTVIFLILFGINTWNDIKIYYASGVVNHRENEVTSRFIMMIVYFAIIILLIFVPYLLNFYVLLIPGFLYFASIMSKVFTEAPNLKRVTNLLSLGFYTAGLALTFVNFDIAEGLVELLIILNLGLGTSLSFAGTITGER